MKKLLPSLLVFLPLVFILLGTPIGEKTASMSILYGFTAVISLFLLVSYCLIVINKDKWFLLLFSSVFIVNAGYYLLAISRTIDVALIANRISYLGSVFLPLSILMSILHICNLKYKKIIPCILLGIAFSMFLLTASGGILDIYYKEVWFSTLFIPLLFIVILYSYVDSRFLQHVKKQTQNSYTSYNTYICCTCKFDCLAI